MALIDGTARLFGNRVPTLSTSVLADSLLPPAGICSSSLQNACSGVATHSTAFVDVRAQDYKLDPKSSLSKNAVSFGVARSNPKSP